MGDSKLHQGPAEGTKGFKGSEKCPQCSEGFDTSSRRAIQETCGHVKCRPCFIKNDDGCLECKGQKISTTSIQETEKGDSSSSPGQSSKVLDTKSNSKPVILLKFKTETPKWTSRNKYLQNGIVGKPKKSKNKSQLDKKKTIFTCELCDRIFPKKSFFEYHTRTHTGERPYQCSVCDKRYISAYQLNRHMLIHKESDSVCSYCNKRLASKDLLAIHLRSKHTNERPYVCDKCPKSYPSQLSLTRHALTHSEKKDFLCSECGLTFMSNNTLSMHMISHQKERNFPCNRCRARFKKQLDLDRHKLTHDELSRTPCPFSNCNRRFRRKDHVIRHFKLTHDLSKEEANEAYNSFKLKVSLNSESRVSHDTDMDAKNLHTTTEHQEEDKSDICLETNARVAALSIDASTSSVTLPSNRPEIFGNDEQNINYDSESYQRPSYSVSGISQPLPSTNPPNTVLEAIDQQPQTQGPFMNNVAAATSVIRSIESLDPRYQQRPYGIPVQIPKIVTTHEPAIQSDYYATGEHQAPLPPEEYKTSLMNDGIGPPANVGNNFDPYAHLRHPVVIDNVTGSSLYLDVRYGNEQPYRQYLSPNDPRLQPVYNSRQEYPDYYVPREIAIPEPSRTLLDLSFKNRDVYSTYPDAIAVEQLNNQRVSPASRYPRTLQEEQDVEIRRPENFSVIRRASPSYRVENPNSSKPSGNEYSSNLIQNDKISHQENVETVSSDKVLVSPTPTSVTNHRESQGSSSTGGLNPSLNRDPRKNFLWENFNRINQD